MENEKKLSADEFILYKSPNSENSRSGIKLLLSMKGNSEVIENETNEDEIFESEGNEQLNCEEVLEEMNEEEYSKTLQELDHLLLNVIKTKQKLRLRKLKEQIKTREDCLKYFNIKDNDEFAIPPEPAMINSKYINKFKINNNSKSNQDFNSIKEKLKNQEKILNQQEKDALFKSKDNLFLTNYSAHTKNEIDIYNEIKLAESKCDYLLDDIDQYIKMGEELSK